MNAEQEEEVEAEARRSLEQSILQFCRRGYELRRVKNGHIEPARLVSVTDENYFRYHSQGFWRILPEKLKSG
ncbi:unnamed protein product [Anisakis simplex]|uniref:WYL domain-containing protein n=1 Tax=Anisakis simplex TaxID=6269 RepID=A0A0M3JLP5_ANISI|nr:unnamed protein product [Anisakis simplex]